MKITYFVLFLFLLIPVTGKAKLTVTIKKLKGEVLFNGKRVNDGTRFVENGVIEVKASSYLKLFVKEYNSTFAVSPNSKLQLKFKKNDQNSPFTMLNGLLRWATQGKSQIKGFIRSKTVSLGVRGTDFLMVVNELLGETEIYCFSGKVIMQNRKKKEDRALINVNDWGGIGGRFGKGVGDAVAMTQKQIDHVKTLLE